MPGPRALSLFSGAARAMWQLLPGIPSQYSSQLEWIKISVACNKILYPGVGQHQTTTPLRAPWGSCFPLLVTETSLGFLTWVKRSPVVWISEAPSCCWSFQQSLRNISTANFNDVSSHIVLGQGRQITLKPLWNLRCSSPQNKGCLWTVYKPLGISSPTGTQSGTKSILMEI